MKFNNKTIYIGLFFILYLIVAFSSFFHAVSFFALANVLWMSVILAFAFEIGQAAVLFSLLTSSKDRSRIMPWVLMTMFTLVQVIGNVYSSYKYIIQNSSENLRYFKEPIFIWTSLPDDQANVIIVYLVGALLPIASLLLTSMITNYLEDNKNENKQIIGTDTVPDGSIKGPKGDQGKIENEETIIVPEPSQKGPNPPIIINSPEELDKVYKEEYKNKEQTTDETKNIEEEPIKTENNDEDEQDISEEPIVENNQLNENSLKEAENLMNDYLTGLSKNENVKKSHFINK